MILPPERDPFFITGPAVVSLTQERLRELLDYDPLTGIFRWRISRTGVPRAGHPAGGPNGDGYIAITVENKKYRAHRLVWFWVHGRWPDGTLDHIDRDRSNNRLSNLRDITFTKNLWNRRLSKANKSGFPGVSKHPRSPGWVAYIGVASARHYLGYFATPEAASAAFEAAAVRLRGEFATHER